MKTQCHVLPDIKQPGIICIYKLGPSWAWPVFRVMSSRSGFRPGIFFRGICTVVDPCDSTLCLKKWATFIVTITLAVVDHFSKIFTNLCCHHSPDSNLVMSCKCQHDMTSQFSLKKIFFGCCHQSIIYCCSRPLSSCCCNSGFSLHFSVIYLLLFYIS